jgi:hypothetical protein
LNDLGIRVVRDQTYEFTADGTWWDCSIRVGPAGYTSDEVVGQGASRLSFNTLTESARRLPHGKWFALICGIDNDRSTYFTVGVGTTWQAQAPGTLGCFANDIGLMYGNNSGFVTLSVTRTR